MPGATIKNPRENCLLFGRLTALIVCQAISIAMTVVLPAPVASFKASLTSSGLDCSFAPRMWSQNFSPLFPNLGATSVSQITVSTASIWQKKGRRLSNLWCRQCCSRRAVSGDTCQSLGLGSARQEST